MARGTEHRRGPDLADLLARSVAAAFKISHADAAAHVTGAKCADVPTETWSVFSFGCEADAACAHALLARRGLRAMRTSDEMGERVWLRWTAAPDRQVVRLWAGRVLDGLEPKLANGTTAAPYFKGSGAVGFDGKPMVLGHLMVAPANDLGLLARKIGGGK